MTREKIEAREETQLAPYAMLAGRSKGRKYPLSEHPLRTAFMRDRDRIIHSAAFRRMEYKTQVFIPHEKDHYRTRLTHTIEVAQISRTLARSLRLNEDLAEAIALVHDLGHTPFGHAGEDVLDELLAGQGGFNHNHQSLRVVDLLEERYPAHPGLNLTYEVREGIAKHETKVKLEVDEFAAGRQPTLEASLVDIADEIAYNSHDIDDGLSSGIINADDLKKHGFYHTLGLDQIDDGDHARYAMVRAIIDKLATDVISETQRRLTRGVINSVDDVRNCENKLIGYSSQIAAATKELKEFLHSSLYKSNQLINLSDWASEIIRALFEFFTGKPSALPDRFQKMLAGESVLTVAADYIAGMTDRYAVERYKQLRRK
jgi:dGTPase